MDAVATTRVGADPQRVRPRWALAIAAASIAVACGDPATPPAADAKASAEVGGLAIDSGAGDAAAGADAAAPDAAAEESTTGLDAAPSDQEPTEDGALADVPPEAIGDTGTADAGPVDGGADVAADATSADAAVVSCKPGSQSCEGAKLKTCGSKGDGWILTNCFPGTTCNDGQCVPVENNLIIAFDTSGSMNDTVKVNGQPKCPPGFTTWPECEYVDPKFAGGCTRMGVSKHVFKQALAKIDDKLVRMTLFRFPQKTSGSASASCTAGYYSGSTTIGGDTGDEGVSAAAPAWYWNGLGEVLCVPFPANAAAAIKDAMLLWMDGKEEKNPPNPELRSTGSTPIGKTLFYVGEYIRTKVVIDGKDCADDATCGNVNYVCKAGKCVDPSRSCRETVVVLFTDGGESNSNNYFAPWVQAKRLSTGLGCAANADCAPGATCQTIKKCKNAAGILIDCQADGECGAGQKCAQATLCLPKDNVTGWFCSKGMAPCLPDATSGPTACAAPAVCVQDPRPGLTVTAKVAANSVLRSYDGAPISVKVIVVDISGATDAKSIAASASIAIAGGGKLLGADASDPAALLDSLDAAFDFKNKKICGVTY